MNTTIGTTVQGWMSDLTSLASSAVQLNGQLSPQAPAQYIAPTPSTGLSTTMMVAGVLGVIIVIVLVKKVM